MNRKSVFLLFLMVVLSAVPSLADQARLQADMQAMKYRLGSLEQNLASLRSGEAAGGSARQVADLQAAVDSLRVEFQAIAGQVDDMVRENRQLKDEVGLLRDEMALKDKAIEERIAALEKGATPRAVVSPAPAPTAKVPAPQPVPQPTVAAPAPVVTGTVAPPATSGPHAQYDRALALIQKDKNFVGGEKGMQTFLKEHRGHALSVNAMYWVGEALYGQRRYEDAILQLQDVISQYADHPKAASALLKQAIAFDALGDRASAKATLQKLKDRFSLSPEAARADQLLAQWK